MKLNKEDEILQINALIYTLGKEAEHTFKAFTFGEGDEKKYNKVIEKFDDHFIPQKIVIHERACFHRRVQKEGETAEAFIRNLYELAEHCKFGKQRDEQIRDRIVIGVLDKSLSQKLQMRSDLNLDIAVQLARQSELVNSQSAGQSETRNIERKEDQILQEDQFKMCVTRIRRMLRRFSHVPDVIGYTNKMKLTRPDGRNVPNAIKQAILPWFAGP